MTYIFSNEDSDLATLKWHRHSGGYAYRWFGDTKKLAHRIVLSRMLGRELSSTDMVDHINRNKLDNRRDNLRLADKSLNTINRDIRPDNKTGYTGVHLHWPKAHRDKKWAKSYFYCIQRARNGEKTILYSKYFKTPEEAYKARQEKLKEFD